MIPDTARPTSPLATCLTLIFAVANVVGAQERRFAGYNCAITSPDGWHAITNLPPQPGLIAAFGNAERTRLLTLVVDDRTRFSGSMDHRFVAESEIGIQRNLPGRRLSAKFIEMDGIKGYERVGESTVSGRHVFTVTQVVPADGKLFILQVLRFDGDAGENPEIRESLKSFRFITPPGVPPTSNGASSPAYETGYFMGKMGMTALLIVGVVATVRAIKRRNGKGHASTPPPLPPLSR